MDLDIIGKQMLEALAVQGRIASLGTNLLDFERQIVKVQEDIKRSMDVYSLNVNAREQAEDELDKAINKAEVAEQWVTQAVAELKSANSIVKEAKEELDKYSDDILEGFGSVTLQLEEDKKVVEANRDETLKELDVARQDLENRQAELKVLGIELNLGGASPRPKTTIL